MKIDINSDVGEGVKNEHLLIPYISSCNIACGGHFGDVYSMDKTIKLALENDVKIGAHPSFPDKENFGRKLMQISDNHFKKSIQSQLDLFSDRLSKVDAKLHHIKPHGALYNTISVNEELAVLFIKSAIKYLKNSYLYVPYNSIIEEVALKNNIAIKYEVFADRNYTDDLKLVSRIQKKALLIDKQAVFEHTFFMAKYQKVKTISGLEKEIKAQTFCVHSDTENALEIVKYLHHNLIKNGVSIA